MIDGLEVSSRASSYLRVPLTLFLLVYGTLKPELVFPDERRNLETDSSSRVRYVL